MLIDLDSGMSRLPIPKIKTTPRPSEPAGSPGGALHSKRHGDGVSEQRTRSDGVQGHSERVGAMLTRGGASRRPQRLNPRIQAADIKRFRSLLRSLRLSFACRCRKSVRYGVYLIQGASSLSEQPIEHSLLPPGNCRNLPVMPTPRLPTSDTSRVSPRARSARVV